MSAALPASTPHHLGMVSSEDEPLCALAPVGIHVYRPTIAHAPGGAVPVVPILRWCTHDKQARGAWDMPGWVPNWCWTSQLDYNQPAT